MTIFLFGEPTGHWADSYTMPSYHELPVSYSRFYPSSWQPSPLQFIEPHDWLNSYYRPRRPRNQTSHRHRRSADSTTKRSDPILLLKHAAQPHVQETQQPQNLQRIETQRPERPERPQSVETQPPSPTPSDHADEQVVHYQPRVFEIDCSEFRPESVHVKVINNRLLVEAKEEHHTSQGYVRLELAREFQLGDRFDLASIKCRLTAQGSLQIEVPCEVPQSENEAINSIAQSGEADSQSQTEEWVQQSGEQSTVASDQPETTENVEEVNNNLINSATVEGQTQLSATESMQIESDQSQAVEAN